MLRKVKMVSDKMALGYLGRKPVLPPQLEYELIKFCLNTERNFFSLTKNDVKDMAFFLVIRNSRMLCNEMDRNLKKKHPQSALRKPLETLFPRGNCFMPEYVATFFYVSK
jgi:hypothetical protein